MTYWTPFSMLPVRASGRFRLHGRKYFVGQAGVQTLQLCDDLFLHGRTFKDSYWAVRRRHQIRLIQRLNRRALLTLLVESAPDPAILAVAIWLRGRCGGSLGTTTLSRFRDAPEDATRKETARALKRMGGWAPLQSMVQHDPNARIRRIATVRPPAPHPSRLARFLQHAHHEPIAPGPAVPMIVTPDLDRRQGRPPKLPWTIRSILERIRLLVSQAHTLLLL